MRSGPGTPPGVDLVDSVAGRIGEHPSLLVLDNCEHLTAACREVAGPATLVVRRQPDGTWLTVADEWNPLTGTATARP